MAKQKLKQHQHVVPRLYLRGWADDDDQIAVLDRGMFEPRTLSVSNSAVRKRFYNFRDDSGMETDAVEDWLGRHVETPVGGVLADLRAGAEFGDVDRRMVANFVAAQLVRTPTVFAYMDQIDAHITPLIVLTAVAKRANLDVAAMTNAERQYVLAIARQAWEKYAPEDRRRSKLRTMSRKLDEYATQIAAWHWNVVSAPEPALLLGDSPVVTVNTKSDGWSGLVPAGSPLWMPLSPTQLLVAEPQKPLGSNMSLESELARYVNTNMARASDWALFNAPGVSWPSELVFPRQRPALPTPSVTWSAAGDTEKPTFPARFPAVASAVVRDLLDQLGAVDIVE